MAVPKRKTSRSNTRSRRANWKATATTLTSCPQCSAPKQPHIACPSCGTYRGTEVIDVQTLLPFDTRGVIVESLKKTNRVAFIDEDVPGGATAFMMQQVLERDRGYDWLDSEPRTIPGKEHRPAYGSDGDYWSKPNRETIFEAVYALMREADPKRYPGIL